MTPTKDGTFVGCFKRRGDDVHPDVVVIQWAETDGQRFTEVARREILDGPSVYEQINVLIAAYKPTEAEFVKELKDSQLKEC